MAIRTFLVLFLISLGLAMVFHEQLQPICTVPYTDENFNVAHKTCYFLSELDDPVGQYVLALMYLNGEGVAVDDAKALRLFQASAELGFAPAQNEFGRMYYNGRGIEVNHRMAAGWFRAAAEQGHAAAQYNLGNLYLAGQGVVRDEAEAVRWLEMAAEQGNLEAQSRLRVIEAASTGSSQY